ARDLLLTGRMVDSAEMLRLGLVSRIVPDADCQRELIETAALVAGQAPLATRLTRTALRDQAFGSVEEAIRWEALAQPITLTGTDLIEGLSASRERRAPRFTGR
ncbi:MAG: enoyl-CoA hydratase-related protein, partial [Candidatus Nanopelagicales bacterium]|nr:enoyl-CoA hydratase-related protein [Candidatus Nanopelagicales bacterium]